MSTQHRPHPRSRPVPVRHRGAGRLVVTGALSVLAAASLAACGSDDDTSADAASLTSDYCAGIAAMEAYGESVFGALPDEPTIDELFVAEQQLYDFASENGYLEPARWPAEIRDDAAKFWAGFEARLGPDHPQPTAEQSAAEERLLAWESANCER